MADSIELTLKSVHGVIYNKNLADVNTVSRVKACVGFSGSAPNMQVSSFTMCPRTGNLVVESNGLETDMDICETSTPQSTMMNAKFDDPLETKHARRRLSSSQSASSGASSSTYRPHLQFELPGETKETEETKDTYRDEKLTTAVSNSRSIHLIVTLRSDDPEASNLYLEGVANLKVPEKFETLPVTLDLPVTSTVRNHPQETSAQSVYEGPGIISFDNSAIIRVVLTLSTRKSPEWLANDSSSGQSELILSENLDELQLGGMMKMMHEKEEIEDARIRAAKLLNLRNENGADPKRTIWFLCNGSNDFGPSFQTFFDILKDCDGQRRNFRSKNFDADQDLFLTSTMASTIDTTDSLGI